MNYNYIKNGLYQMSTVIFNPLVNATKNKD